MKRRFFIASSVTLGATAIVGLSAWQFIPRNQEDLSTKALINDLSSLDTAAIKFASDWTLGHNLAHMAQSIEYSMIGYPVHKSDLFKSTVGKAAFSAFSSKGYMKHNLSEEIPGAPSVAQTSAEAGKQRLIDSLVTFEQFTGQLAEHFAYGPLSKAEYALAHVLHVKDHFSQMV